VIEFVMVLDFGFEFSDFVLRHSFVIRHSDFVIHYELLYIPTHSRLQGIFAIPQVGVAAVGSRLADMT